MANGQINKLLEFANMQMAAEAFLARETDSIPNQPAQSDIEARLKEGNTHTNIFTPTQATQFTDTNTGYDVIAQYRNDPLLPEPASPGAPPAVGGTGFSATLFKNRANKWGRSQLLPAISI